MGISLSDDVLAQRLQALMRQQGFAEAEVSGLAPLAGGNARRAWSFEVRWQQAGSAATRDCVLLARTEPGQLDVDARSEFDVLRGLAGHGLPAPEALCLDADGTVLGMPGMVMQRGSGRSDIGELLQPRSTITGPLSEQLVRVAARLHSVAWPTPSRAWQPLQMLLDWCGRFEAVRLEPLPALGVVFEWLEQRLPAPIAPSLVHGDLRLGNFLHDGRQLTLLLDWELAHVGDPAEDLAWLYRRLWSPEAFLPFEQALAVYEQEGARPIDRTRLDWYGVFVEVRLAVISLSAIRRFTDGETRNLRHAGRRSMVNECLLEALRRIERLEAAAC